jgi:hypothetical protein
MRRREQVSTDRRTDPPISPASYMHLIAGTQERILDGPVALIAPPGWSRAAPMRGRSQKHESLKSDAGKYSNPPVRMRMRNHVLPSISADWRSSPVIVSFET